MRGLPAGVRRLAGRSAGLCCGVMAATCGVMAAICGAPRSRACVWRRGRGWEDAGRSAHVSAGRVERVALGSPAQLARLAVRERRRITRSVARPLAHAGASPTVGGRYTCGWAIGGDAAERKARVHTGEEQRGGARLGRSRLVGKGTSGVAAASAWMVGCTGEAGCWTGGGCGREVLRAADWRTFEKGGGSKKAGGASTHRRSS